MSNFRSYSYQTDTQQHGLPVKYQYACLMFINKYLVIYESASAISWSTTFGSANVLISPSSSSCLEAIFLRILLIIFPLLVFGRPGAQWIFSGAANAPIWLNHTRSYQSCKLFNLFIRNGLHIAPFLWVIKTLTLVRTESTRLFLRSSLYSTPSTGVTNAYIHWPLTCYEKIKWLCWKFLSKMYLL